MDWYKIRFLESTDPFKVVSDSFGPKHHGYLVGLSSMEDQCYNKKNWIVIFIKIITNNQN